MAVAILLSVILSYIIVAVYQKLTNAMCKSKKKLTGRTVLVTGGTSGMGLQIAKVLARRGARVIVACPFPEEGATGLDYIKRKSSNSNIVFKLLDLASIESVRAFANDILATEDRLDILVNNAGVGVPGDFLTKDGMNFIMQVNYFGTYQLTLLLLPLLIKSGTHHEPSRIVNTASILHWLGTVDLKYLNATNYFWSAIKIYANSKLCVLLFTHELAKRLQGTNVVVNCVDPGAVGTRIFNSFNTYLGPLITLFCWSQYKTPIEGAQTALHVALDEKAGQISGQMFKNCGLTRGASRGYCDSTAKQLWNESKRLVEISDGEIEKSFSSL